MNNASVITLIDSRSSDELIKHYFKRKVESTSAAVIYYQGDGALVIGFDFSQPIPHEVIAHNLDHFKRVAAREFPTLGYLNKCQATLDNIAAQIIKCLGGKERCSDLLVKIANNYYSDRTTIVASQEGKYTEDGLTYSFQKNDKFGFLEKVLTSRDIDIEPHTAQELRNLANAYLEIVVAVHNYKSEYGHLDSAEIKKLRDTNYGDYLMRILIEKAGFLIEAAPRDLLRRICPDEKYITISQNIESFEKLYGDHGFAFISQKGAQNLKALGVSVGNPQVIPDFHLTQTLRDDKTGISKDETTSLQASKEGLKTTSSSSLQQPKKGHDGSEL